jgi:predicted ATPase
LADADSVVIGHTTRILIGELFDIQDLGTHALKGIPRPVHAWRVLRQRAVESRFEATSGGAPETALIGREQELDTLTACWHRAAAGASQVALISGEAGIGKSRIVHALRQSVLAAACPVIGLQGSSYHGNSAFYPFIEYLNRTCGFQREAGPDAHLDQLEEALQPLSTDVAEAAYLLAELLSIPTGERYRPLNLSPQVRKRRTEEAIVELFAARFAQQPSLFILEDAHWFDPSSLELFEMVAQRARLQPVLFIITARLGFAPIWSGLGEMTQIELKRLGPDQCADVARAVAGGATLSAAVLQQILARADGVPLFVEELTKGALALEQGDNNPTQGAGSRPPSLAVPARLQDSLMARLEQGAPVRAVAQVGAAIGRTFTFELLSLVCDMSHRELEQALAQLVEAKIVHGQGQPPDASYSFKHALVQDAAYSTLLLSRRQQLHGAIARTLVDELPEIAQAQPEVVAQHFMHARLPRDAFVRWLFAGKKALYRSANVEAIHLFREGMTALEAIPEGPDTLGMELELRTSLGIVLMAAQGYAAQDVLDNFARARELCKMLGDMPQVFVVLFGLWVFNLVRADRRAVPELCDQLLATAERSGDVAAMTQAQGVSALTKFYPGKHAEVIDHANRALELYDREAHRDNVFVYGDDPAVYAHIYRGLSLFFRGYPDQASRNLEQALALAEELDHPFSIAGALAFNAQLSYLRRDPKLTETFAQRTFALSAEQGFVLFQAVGMLYRGWPCVIRGEPLAGIEHIKAAIELFRATGAQLNGHYFLSHLAEACLAAGRDEDAERALDEARQLAATNLDAYYLPELLRQRGELMLLRGDRAAAWSCFTEALEAARSLDARSLELRAATSLARLAAVRGNAGSALSQLEEVYRWFSEGFDTGDLHGAQALIVELGGTAESADQHNSGSCP